VIIPDDGSQYEARISIPLFVHPDVDTMVECLDGSNKYPPIFAGDDFKERNEKLYY